MLKQRVCGGILALGVVSAMAIAQDSATDESGATTTPDRWSPRLALDVKRVGNVRVSPRGDRVLFEVSQAIMTDEVSEWRTQIHLGHPTGNGTIQLTRGEHSCNGARWSPDGRWIAFTSQRAGDDKTANIFRIRVGGGEAQRLTDLDSSAGNLQWSPDGSMIAFTMSDTESEDEEARKKEKNDARVVDADIKMNRLYVINLDADDDNAFREPRLLTEGDYSVGGRFGGGSFDWSPDGSTIAFTHTPTPKVDDWTKADLSIVNVETGSVTTLLATGASEGQPTYSHDGQWIAFSMSDDPATWAFRSGLHVIPATGGEPRALALTFDERPGIVGWMPDSTRLIVREPYRTVSRLYQVPVDGGAPKALSPEDAHLTSPTLSMGGHFLGFTRESVAEPPEAHVSAVGGYQPKQISAVQDLPDLPLGETMTLTWESTDGRQIEGFLTLPVGYEPETRVPMVVIVHGGPAGVFQERFIGTRGAYPIAAFASEGMAVLRVNPRGSSGYGAEFRYANYEDWGGGDYHDIMTGVDRVIEMGVADPERLGIMGWSYGGFMTSWVITQTDRFKAASIGAAVTNLLSFTGTADIPGFIPDYFGGESWERLDDWLDHSAMGHIENAVTPSLIQHGENDVRVPVSQGYEIYNALKRKGVPVEMVVYPRQPHGIIEPKLQLDAMERNLAWFKEMLVGEEE